MMNYQNKLDFPFNSLIFIDTVADIRNYFNKNGGQPLD